ncbi:MAG: hypothetical protein ACU0GG_06930 [Paracoccaceae bacterium]
MTGRLLLLVLASCALTACSRPLTEAETEFAEDLFGPSLDTSKITVALELGFTPLHKTEPNEVRLVEGTDRACLRTPQPRGAQPPQAFALFNRLHFDNTLYSSDMIVQWPEALRVPQALIFAHELAHAWQWQNRATSGYTPIRAAAESVFNADPYFSEGQSAFYSFGYEQQAAIIEDYVCFAFANPDHPRRAELRAILAPVLPLDAFDAAIGQ